MNEESIQCVRVQCETPYAGKNSNVHIYDNNELSLLKTPSLDPSLSAMCLGVANLGMPVFGFGQLMPSNFVFESEPLFCQYRFYI